MLKVEVGTFILWTDPLSYSTIDLRKNHDMDVEKYHRDDLAESSGANFVNKVQAFQSVYGKGGWSLEKGGNIVRCCGAEFARISTWYFSYLSDQILHNHSLVVVSGGRFQDVMKLVL